MVIINLLVEDEIDVLIITVSFVGTELMESGNSSVDYVDDTNDVID